MLLLASYGGGPAGGDRLRDSARGAASTELSLGGSYF